MSIADETVSFSLEINVEPGYTEIRKVQTILSRTLSLVERACGREDFNVFIDSAQKAVMWANRLRLALLALQAARMAAGDPLAWALAGLAVAEIGADVALEIEGA